MSVLKTVDARSTGRNRIGLLLRVGGFAVSGIFENCFGFVLLGLAVGGGWMVGCAC